MSTNNVPHLLIYVYIFVVGLLFIAIGLITYLVQDLRNSCINRRSKKIDKVELARKEIRMRVCRMKERQAFESEMDDLLMRNWEASYNEFWRDR